jgi:hypothetical protein
VPWTSQRDKPGLVAQRQYPEEIAEKQISEEIPLSWRSDNILWGYVTKYYLKGSGAGFVVPPYAAYWERIWGATPIEDLPRYKELYAFTPYIKACIDVTVNLAISNGFELEGGDDAVREWLLDWCDEHNLLQTLRIIATDMLVFGGGMFEICREDGQAPEEWWLKPLDPVNMRVRRDAYGQVIGYVQLLTMPPAVFTPQDIVHVRWGAKSWWYEFNYGISLLRPLLKIQALINQFENDMATIIHCYTKPMLWIQAGRPDQPFGDQQLNQLMQAFSQRGVATDVFTRGDVNVKPLTSLTKDIKVDYWLSYLYQQRSAVLGVPKIFLAEDLSGTNRATADIVMQEYCARLRMLQTLIGENIETDLFAQLVNAKFGEGIEVPHIAWKPVWEPTLDLKAKYIGELVQLGIILPSEARPQLGYPEQPSEEAIQAAKLLPQPRPLGKQPNATQQLSTAEEQEQNAENFP